MLKNRKLSGNLKELLNSVEHTIKTKKGTFLFQEGMPATELYIVRSGKIQISKISPDGRELSLRICTVGDIVGELTLFTDEAKYLLNAKVIESGEVSILKKDFLEKQLMENGPVTYEFMKYMSDHFRKTQTKFRDLVLHGKKGALYSTLIRMTNSYGVTLDDGSILIDLSLTNQDLANFCGTSRESVNRMLSDLRKNSIISNQKGKMIIHNINFLRNEINCEGCPIDLCRID
ncbi:Crp/Fnr family transcriptional regulator [Calidifontibacillus oryziterrae]|uniref:Crp/Fnr family transcriptional regulator n=1 Tax=Calidifontibacillus oryziterrae TaxID=1191699 RepID=UPI000475D52D|nr:Crp/Fnr family transcriptional regulator [Calidifontibacillus oryziterrae]